jgi:hypothetical protein
VLIAFKEADYFQAAKATAFEVLGRVCHLGHTYGNLSGWQVMLLYPALLPA